MGETNTRFIGWHMTYLQEENHVNDGFQKPWDTSSIRLSILSWQLCRCCLLQIVYYRTSEPLFLPADGGVDAQHRPVLRSETSATGSPFFRSRLSAPLLLCDEHPGGESSPKLPTVITPVQGLKKLGDFEKTDDKTRRVKNLLQQRLRDIVIWFFPLFKYKKMLINYIMN